MHQAAAKFSDRRLLELLRPLLQVAPAAKLVCSTLSLKNLGKNEEILIPLIIVDLWYNKWRHSGFKTSSKRVVGLNGWAWPPSPPPRSHQGSFFFLRLKFLGTHWRKFRLEHSNSSFCYNILIIGGKKIICIYLPTDVTRSLLVQARDPYGSAYLEN